MKLPRKTNASAPNCRFALTPLHPRPRQSIMSFIVYLPHPVHPVILSNVGFAHNPKTRENSAAFTLDKAMYFNRLSMSPEILLFFIAHYDL